MTMDLSSVGTLPNYTSDLGSNGTVVPYNAPAAATAPSFDQMLNAAGAPTGTSVPAVQPQAQSAYAAVSLPQAGAVTQPGTTPGTATQPGVAQPTATQPGVAQSTATQPGLTQSSTPATAFPQPGSTATTPGSATTSPTSEYFPRATATQSNAAQSASGAAQGTYPATYPPPPPGMMYIAVPVAFVPFPMAGGNGAYPAYGYGSYPGWGQPSTTSQSGAAAAGTAGVASPGNTAPSSGSTDTTASHLRLPFAGSADITQPFGPTFYKAEPAYAGYPHFHTGIDYALPVGTPIDAAAGGTVVSAGWDNTGFGNRVVIDHGNGVQTLYGHLEKVEVTPGQTVQAGQEIGQSGSTGNSSGPHLHFGVEQNGRWVDPTSYLNGTVQQTGAGGTAPSAGTVGPDATPAVGGGSTTSSSSSTTALGLDSVIDAVARETGVKRALIAAVMQVESAGDAHAVSPAGAKGLMQLMDTTAASYGVTDIFDPQQNLRAGALYLRDMLNKYGGDEKLALAAYNAGPGAVDQFGGIPPYPETQQYVQKVTAIEQQDTAVAASSGSKGVQ